MEERSKVNPRLLAGDNWVPMIRNDDRRILLFRFYTWTAAIDSLVYLHPLDALMFYFLADASLEKAAARYAAVAAVPYDRAVAYAAKLSSDFVALGFLGEDRGGKRANLDPPEKWLCGDGLREVDLTTRWLYRPLALTLRLTERCARSCRYCNVERRTGVEELSVERWLELVDEALRLGVVSFTLSGGDPLLSPAFLPVVRTITSRGHQPMVATKAYISKELAETLTAAGLRHIQVSVDGVSTDSLAWLLQSPKAAEELFASIRNARAAGLEVDTNTVLTPFNALEFPRLVEKLIGLGVREIRATPYGWSLFSEHPEEFLLADELKTWLDSRIRPLLGKIRRSNVNLVSEGDLRNRFTERAVCTAGMWGLFIQADGKVTTCDQLPSLEPFVVGDCRYQSIQEVWSTSPALQRIRVRREDDYAGTACASCTEFEACANGRGICFRDAMKAYGRPFAPAPYCPRAPLAPRLI